MAYKHLLFIMLITSSCGLCAGGKNKDTFYECRVVPIALDLDNPVALDSDNSDTCNIFNYGTPIEETGDIIKDFIAPFGLVASHVIKLTQKIAFYDINNEKSYSANELTFSQSYSANELTFSQLCNHIWGNGSVDD